MNPIRNYSDYLDDILDSIKKIKQFTNEMTFQEFVEDEKTAYAVVRAFEIIGEATKCLPDEIKAIDQDIPWKEMAGIRDKLIHHYFGVDLKIIWNTIINEISDLELKIQLIQKKID